MCENKERLMALINEERDAFIKAEYGRLQSVMGSEYTENGENKVFHALPEAQKDEGQFTANPEELNLAELAMLPDLVRAIPRLGTLSYMPLFRTSPYEAERLKLLANIHEKLLIGVPCSPEEEKILINGHKDFLISKQDDEVVVIK